MDRSKAIRQGKPLLLLMLLLFSAAAHAADRDSMVTAKAHQLKKRASLIYETKPDSAISFYDQASELFKIVNNKKEAAVCVQNIAFIYDEQRKDSHKALIHVGEALTLWKEANDTSAVANIYKYTGYLQTKLNQTAQAKKNIDTAIRLYIAVNNRHGIAISYYEMATVYDHEKKLDSAVYYLHQAQDIWKRQAGSEDRIFSINNTLLRIYVLNDKLKPAKKPYKQNVKHADKEKISWRDRLAFYYYSWIYHSKRNKEKQAAAYKAKYDNLKAEMTKKGEIV